MTRHGGEVRARSLVVIAIGMLLAVAMVPSTRAATLPLIPVANDDKYEVDRPGSLVIDAPGVLANDMWLKSDLVEIVEGPSKGTLSLGDDGSFKYVPDPSEGSGSDAFVYRIRRALVFSDKAKVDLKIIDAKPTPSPTPRPTPSPTPAPTRTPSPTLPLPTIIPLPTILPEPSIKPTKPPKPTLSPTPSSSPTSRPSPAPSASDTPSPTGEPTDQRGGAVGPRGPGGSGGSPGPSHAPTPHPTTRPAAAEPAFTMPDPAGRAGDREPDTLSVIDATSVVFSGFEWQVPGLLLSVPGLLLVLVVGLQLIGALAWLPVVRRRLGSFQLRPGSTRAG